MPTGTLKFSDPRGLTGFAAAHDVKTGAGDPAGTVGCPRPAAPGKDRRVQYRPETAMDGSPITASFRSA